MGLNDRRFFVGALGSKMTAFSALLAMLTYSFNISALESVEQYDLLLAGGALKTCSSMAQRHCKNGQKLTPGKSELIYTFSNNALIKWQSSQPFIELKSELKILFNSSISTIYAKSNNSPLTKNDFLDRIDESIEKNSNVKHFIRQLPDRAYYALLDIHEVFQQGEDGLRLQEAVSVQDTNNASSIAVYSAFIDQATMRLPSSQQTTQPTIAVVTSSSRDHFESADFYENAFRSLGVNVVWLPITAAWQEAQHLNSLGIDGCSKLVELHSKRHLFARQAVYPKRAIYEAQTCKRPQLIYDALESAQGIFFNGGDQSKTLASLLTPNGEESKALAIIRQRNAQGQLIVGGTSAGTAVQAGGSVGGKPVPMLTNGAPLSAIIRGVFAYDAPSVRCSESANCSNGVNADDVTFRSAGGTGLFTTGVVDTHFSERNREPRLIMTALATQQDFGFGVDETTALLVKYDGSSTLFNVVGERGVFIADLQTHEYRQTATANKTVRQVGGNAHFFPSGTQARLQNGKFDVTWPEQNARKSYEDDSSWRRLVSKKCDGEMVSWSENGVMFIVQGTPATQFYKSSGLSNRLCGYTDLPFVISN